MDPLGQLQIYKAVHKMALPLEPKFEDEKAGNKYKDVCLRCEFKQYVAITVKTN